MRTVRRWLEQFRRGGHTTLADAPRPGRPPKADAAYLAALERAVETPPPTLGVPFDVWTSARLSAYLAETTGVRLAPGWVRALLAQQRFVSGRPKHTLKHLQDRAEVALCEAELAVVGEKGGRRTPTAMSSIIRTRRMSRPIPISAASGTGAAASRRCRRRARTDG